MKNNKSWSYGASLGLIGMSLTKMPYPVVATAGIAGMIIFLYYINSKFYKKVNVCPLAYLRGTTKAKSFIIIDEAQNVTKTQMKLMLTRLGHGSKLIVCGDINQSDLERKSDSGFRHAQQILK